ncbi:NAC domain containing protein [Parasponia andersonii]|uniref:NAC domain containing protein n=1 Tax=Parasponia andersonii TaxID=3476 RepID=A0A2P5BKV6_PARAD|nr:NAC domain containing protein [Parasponia andersonii]
MGSNAVVLPSNLPVGFRFSPTEEEVIGHYLRLKILGMDSEVDPVMAEVDFYESDPWDLTSQSKIESSDPVSWFFYRRKYKYSKSTRSNRKTKTGSWKITGQDHKIKCRATKGFIGGKRVLVFQPGPSAPGKGTYNWVMHEYYLEPDNTFPNQREYVVCRLERKPDEKRQKAVTDCCNGESSGNIMPLAAPAAILEARQISNALFYIFGYQGLGYNEVSPESFPRPICSPDYASEDYATNFANSLIVDPEENNCAVTMDNHFNNSSLRASSKRSNFRDGLFSSDTDIEGGNQRYFQSLQDSGSFDSPGGSKKVRHLKMAKTPIETLHTSTVDNAIRETIVNQLFEENASSDDSTAYVGDVNCINLVSEEDVWNINSLDLVTEECYDVSVRGGVRQKRIQPQKKVSSAAISGKKVREAAKHSTASVDQPRKEKNTAESQDVRNKAQSSNSEKHLKSARCESTLGNWNSFFIFGETSPVSSCNSTPPSVYVSNAIVGTVLFVVFVRELVLFGSWC